MKTASFCQNCGSVVKMKTTCICHNCGSEVEKLTTKDRAWLKEHGIKEDSPRFKMETLRQLAKLPPLPPLPTYEEARKIVDNAEIVNEGTDHEFVKGCFGNKYRDAVTVLQMESDKKIKNQKLKTITLS